MGWLSFSSRASTGGGDMTVTQAPGLEVTREGSVISTSSVPREKKRASRAPPRPAPRRRGATPPVAAADRWPAGGE